MADPILRLPPKPGPEEIAYLKYKVVQKWLSKLAEIKEGEKIKDRVTRDFVQLYNSGLLIPEGFPVPKHISKASLYSWKRIFKDKGIKGLIPKFKWRRKLLDNLIPMIPSYKKIVIPGNPQLRFKSRKYLPEIMRQWKWPPLRCPVMIVIFFSMEVPKGIPMRIRMRMLRRESPHLGNPHLDRLILFIKDCLKGLVFEDDSQIIVLHAEKHYHWDAKTEIYVRRMKGLKSS